MSLGQFLGFGFDAQERRLGFAWQVGVLRRLRFWSIRQSGIAGDHKTCLRITFQGTAAAYLDFSLEASAWKGSRWETQIVDLQNA